MYNIFSHSNRTFGEAEKKINNMSIFFTLSSKKLDFF